MTSGRPVKRNPSLSISSTFPYHAPLRSSNFPSILLSILSLSIPLPCLALNSYSPSVLSSLFPCTAFPISIQIQICPSPTSITPIIHLPFSTNHLLTSGHSLFHAFPPPPLSLPIQFLQFLLFLPSPCSLPNLHHHLLLYVRALSITGTRPCGR